MEIVHTHSRIILPTMYGIIITDNILHATLVDNDTVQILVDLKKEVDTGFIYHNEYLVRNFPCDKGHVFECSVPPEHRDDIIIFKKGLLGQLSYDLRMKVFEYRSNAILAVGADGCLNIDALYIFLFKQMCNRNHKHKLHRLNFKVYRTKCH